MKKNFQHGENQQQPEVGGDQKEIIAEMESIKNAVIEKWSIVSKWLIDNQERPGKIKEFDEDIRSGNYFGQGLSGNVYDYLKTLLDQTIYKITEQPENEFMASDEHVYEKLQGEEKDLADIIKLMERYKALKGV